jgi:hypothetical protein
MSKKPKRTPKRKQKPRRKAKPKRMSKPKPKPAGKPKRRDVIAELERALGDDVMDVYNAATDDAEWLAAQKDNEFVLRRFVELLGDGVPEELPPQAEKTLEEACAGKAEGYRSAYRIGFADGAKFFVAEYYGPLEETVAFKMGRAEVED